MIVSRDLDCTSEYKIVPERQPVAWLLQRSYKPPKGSVSTDGIETLALRFYLLRRFAARKRTSLAHVTGLASLDSAADCTMYPSAPDREAGAMRLSVRYQRAKHRFKRWLTRFYFRLTGGPKIIHTESCPQCGGKVQWGVRKNTARKTGEVHVSSGFSCTSCGWEPDKSRAT